MSLTVPPVTSAPVMFSARKPVTPTYNYDRFSLDQYDFSSFQGPRPGEEAPDIVLGRNQDGSERRLSDLRGKWVVLETGSVTCPIYVNHINPMTRLAEKHPDKEFVVLYVREAHPGGKIGPHQSRTEKERAAALTRELGETRAISVDDLEGTAHKAYGSMPNMVYIIDPQGRVAYRSNWQNPEKIEQLLENPEAAFGEDTINPPEAPLKTTFAILMKGGWQAVWDFARELPAMMRAKS